MRPKIEAYSSFAKCTGSPAQIGALEHAAAVLAGRSGTTIVARTGQAAAELP